MKSPPLVEFALNSESNRSRGLPPFEELWVYASVGLLPKPTDIPYRFCKGRTTSSRESRDRNEGS